MTRFWRCESCGYVYPEATPSTLWRLHRCAPVRNPAHQPDRRRPRYDPREFIVPDTPRDEAIELDLFNDSDNPRRLRPPRVRAEGRGRTLAFEED